jgi:hypothetical protein
MISTENEQNQRPDRKETVAERIRAVPRWTRREFPGGFVGADRPEAGQLYVPAILGDADAACGEPA